MNKKCPICENKKCNSILQEKNGVLARYGFLNQGIDTSETNNELSQSIYYCNKCDFAWNVLFEYKNIKYNSDSIIESGTFSKKYMNYQHDTASYLNKIMGTIPEVIVEIGAGSGIFIEHFNANKKIAIEPSDEAKRINKSITVYNEFYTRERFDFPANLVVSRQVLEHIPEPVDFIQNIISSFYNNVNQEEFFIYLEVPNSMLTYRYGRFYDYYYEHCNYFSVNSLIALSKAVNMKIIDLTTGMDGEVISILMSSFKMEAKNIISKIDNNKSELKKKLKISLEADKKILAWGASGNGVQILNVLGITKEVISHVIDSDINKQGKFLPGTFQKIISPEEAVKYNPDIIIVLTQFHKNEIEKQCSKYFENVEIWFV